MILSEEQDKYLEQVNDDIRGKASLKVHEALRQPPNLERWMLALKGMKRDTESQLAADKADRAEKRLVFLQKGDTPGWLAYVAKRERRRADIIRVKNGTENKLDEATGLERTFAHHLYAAIHKHRNDVLCALNDDDSSLCDEELWSVLDDD